jgi:hypothetical protein
LTLDERMDAMFAELSAWCDHGQNIPFEYSAKEIRQHETDKLAGSKKTHRCPAIDWWTKPSEANEKLLNLELFPRIFNVFLQTNAVPATSAPSERVFSRASYINRARRARLKPHMLCKLVFLSASHQFGCFDKQLMFDDKVVKSSFDAMIDSDSDNFEVHEVDDDEANSFPAAASSSRSSRPAAAAAASSSSTASASSSSSSSSSSKWSLPSDSE